MLELKTTTVFKRHLKICKKRNKDLSKIADVIELLRQEKPIPSKYKDHKLTGSLMGSRDLHIEPDWILIYRISGDSLILEYTGTHSDIFK
jgi:mRNA interferase YafQ